jgi:hypothetical protein
MRFKSGGEGPLGGISTNRTAAGARPISVLRPISYDARGVLQNPVMERGRGPSESRIAKANGS